MKYARNIRNKDDRIDLVRTTETLSWKFHHSNGHFIYIQHTFIENIIIYVAFYVVSLVRLCFYINIYTQFTVIFTSSNSGYYH